MTMSSQDCDPPHMSRLVSPSLGNHECADCSAPGPEWASVNLGVVLCISCSAAHRNIGSHISQVNKQLWNYNCG